ncbi:MAG: EAL domain-containing protein [Lachnospiraceae bacterium]|nr:EAL domain-containing protein [Lachnospiraceae bacterium]
MLYNFNFDIAAIFVCSFSIYCVIEKKGLIRTQNRLLLGLLFLTILCSLLDIFASLSLRPGSTYPYLLTYTLNLCYHIVHSLMPPLALLFLGYLTGEHFKYSFYYFSGVMFPYGVLLVVLFTNPLHHMLFTVTPDHIYYREYGFFIFYVVASCYLVAMIIKLYRFRFALDRTKRWAFLGYLYSSIIAIIVQFFFPTLLVELFIQSMALLGVIFTIDNLREMLDQNTHSYNRTILLEDMDVYLNAHQEYQLLVVKVNGLVDYIPKLGLNAAVHFLQDITAFLQTLPDTELYHCGEGRFVMIYMNATKREKLMDQIRTRFAEPWSFDQIDVLFHVEVCYTESPAEIRDAKDLYPILQAPISRSRCKIGTTDIYNYQRYIRENMIIDAIKRGIEHHNFEIYYQPMLDVVHHCIPSAEALLRLNDDTLGYISPEEFIPLAERNGYIIQLGDYVMEEVCRFVSENDLNEFGIQYIDINLSSVQCMDSKLAKRFLDLMKKYHIHPDQIRFELTEAAIFQNKELLPMLIERFAKQGVGFVLDDYGIGNSNIASIFQLPFSLVKIDKSLLWEAEKSQQALTILKNIMNMVKSSGMELLMEGIETEHQLAWLMDNGCDFCQGYYFSRAIPSGDFIKYVARYNKISE